MSEQFVGSTPTLSRFQGLTNWLWLFCCAIALLLGSGLLLHWSERFRVAGDETRPIVGVVVLLGAMSVAYLFALYSALKLPDSRTLGGLIFGVALLLRLIVVPSAPILEIDYFRYLWDGHSVLAGVSPYAYSPLQARQAAQQVDAQKPRPVQRLADLQHENVAAKEIVEKIHFADLPSIYPPVSVAVFTLCAAIADDRPVDVQILVIKSVLTAFDLATVIVVLELLRRLGWSRAWAISYAWCPLVIKEIANAGHLDAIAVFFGTAAVCQLVYWWTQPDGRQASSFRLDVSAVLLALAVGAKLYPVLLAPLFAIAILRRWGVGPTFRWAIVFSVAAGMLLVPMLVPWHGVEVAPANQNRSPADASAVEQPFGQQAQAKSLGVFLANWKINDVIFLFIEENMRPTAAETRSPWFVVAPAKLRNSIGDAAVHFGIERERVAFSVARGTTLVIFLLILSRAAWTFWRHPTPEVWLGSCFLTIAWFWALSPTLNPWYWTWALPLIPFARCRAWLVVAGLLAIYYLRFWFQIHAADEPVWGTAYRGAEFYDLVVVWLEHVPWMLLLAGETIWRAVKRDHSLGTEPEPKPA